MSFRSSASFGKRMEYVTVGELLKRGHDVYMTLVDDQQIDCIIRQEAEGQIRYLDIQIKARSKTAKNPGLFAALEIRKPRPDFFFIFYSEAIDTYWVIPSLTLIQEANQNKTGDNAGKYSITLVNKNSLNPRPRFDLYKNAFHLLDVPHPISEPAVVKKLGRKNRPIYDYLMSLSGDMTEITISFERFEEIIPGKLPKSAHTHEAWWSNDRSGYHTHANAWLAAGWEKKDFSLEEKWVRFVRK